MNFFQAKYSNRYDDIGSNGVGLLPISKIPQKSSEPTIAGKVPLSQIILGVASCKLR